jgi:hypothetical protein
MTERSAGTLLCEESHKLWKEPAMSTQTNHLPAARSQALRVRPAAAVGLGLLLMGLAIGLIVGRLQAGPVQQQASPVVAHSAAKGPVLTWRDDYGTRHLGERP